MCPPYVSLLGEGKQSSPSVPSRGPPVMLMGAGGAQPRDLPPGTIFLTVRWSLSVVSMRRHPLCTNTCVMSRGEKDLTGARPDLGREPWEKWVRTQSSSWPLPQGDVGAGCWWLKPPPGPGVFLSRSAERSCFCCGLLPPMSRGREPGGPGPKHQGQWRRQGARPPAGWPLESLMLPFAITLWLGYVLTLELRCPQLRKNCSLCVISSRLL